MSTTNAPFGLRAVNHESGQVVLRTLENAIPSGYGTSIYFGDPITITGGAVVACASAASGNQVIDGVFQGVTYTDASGQSRISPNWVAGTVATGVAVKFISSGGTVFEIQADGPVAQNKLGVEGFANIVAGQASPSGQSAVTFSTSTTVSTGSQGALRIVGVSKAPGNAWGDAYTVVRVILAKSILASGVSA